MPKLPRQVFSPSFTAHEAADFIAAYLTGRHKRRGGGSRPERLVEFWWESAIVFARTVKIWFAYHPEQRRAFLAWFEDYQKAD